MVMTSIKHLTRTVGEQLNRDNGKKALSKERSSIGFLSTSQLKDYLSRYELLVTLPEQLINKSTNRFTTENQY